MSSQQTEFHFINGIFEDLLGPEGGDISALKWSGDQNPGLWCGTAAGELYFMKPENPWNRIEPPFRPMLDIQSIEITTGTRQSILVLSSEGSLSRSSDNGKTWKTDFGELSDDFIHVIRHQPLHSGLVYAGLQKGLFFSPDSGFTWQRFENWTSDRAVTAIAFDEVDPLTFFIADSDGFNARVLMTVNGGYTFEPILDGDEYFSHIHTLIYQHTNQLLWAAGSGFSWRTANAHITDEIIWINRDKNLPVSSITCMAESSNHKVILGSNGAGLYRYTDSKNAWKRIDIEPQRRYVRCLAASPLGLAAGFADRGVAIEKNGEWHESNQQLYARNISRIQRFSDCLAVVANEQLYIGNQDKSWNTVPGFQLVQDVLVHGQNLYTSGLYSGIFCKTNKSESVWEDLDLPVSRATLVRTNKTGQLFVLTHLKRDRIRFYKYCSNTINSAWTVCCPDIPFSGTVYDFAVDVNNAKLSMAISTSQGLFCYNSNLDSWISSHINDSHRVTGLYRSRLNPDVLYATAGRNLLRSHDFGLFSDYDPIAEFPSKISSLTLSGLHFESIWISTENGGIYVSHYPNCWNALQPAEMSLPINQIAVDTVSRGAMFIGTKGISCWKLSIPSLSARLEKHKHNNYSKLVYTYQNPGETMDVDIHYLLVKPGRIAFQYLHINHDKMLCRSAKPKPVRIILSPHTHSKEITAGFISEELLDGGLKPAVAFCIPETFHPVCGIQTI